MSKPVVVVGSNETNQTRYAMVEHVQLHRILKSGTGIVDTLGDLVMFTFAGRSYHVTIACV